MLNREQAATQMRQYMAANVGALPGPRLGFRIRLSGERELSKALREWLQQSNANAWTSQAIEIAKALDGVHEKTRTNVFADVAPTLAGPLARWWVWAQAAPYQAGWERRGFRCAVPGSTHAVRMSKLRSIVDLTRHWPQDAGWFAAWSSHIVGWTWGLPELFASEIDAGDRSIADTLLAAALGRHPVSGTTVIGLQALLGCSDPDQWEHVAEMLHSAGRQEGLRSAVLEASDVAHPGAFARILDVVVTDDLTRFAGTVRAAGVWFGEQIDIRSKTLAPALADLRDMLIDARAATSHPDAIAQQLAAPAGTGTPTETFLRMWAAALHDAPVACTAAAQVLAGSADPAMRRAAARLLAELGLVSARTALQGALADPDLGVYANAVSAWPTHPVSRDRHASLDAAGVQLLLERVRTLGKQQQVDTGVVGVRLQSISASQAADVILAHRSFAAAPPEAFAAASPEGRNGAARVLAERPGTNRAALLAFLTDAASSVRATVIKALLTLPDITPEEARLLEAALRRKASDLRRGAVTLLLKQHPDQLAATVVRLAAGTADQVRAAAEIAERAGLPAPTGITAPTTTVAGAPTVTVLGTALPVTLVPRPDDRTPAMRPTPPERDWRPLHAGCKLIVTSLRAWLAEHADVEVRQPDGSVTLASNLGWLPRVDTAGALPLPELTGPWWERIGPQLTDGGLELLLLQFAIPRRYGPGTTRPWTQTAAQRIVGYIPPDDANPSRLMWPIVARMVESQLRASWIDPALDAVETIFADLPLAETCGPPAVMSRLGRHVPTDQPGHHLQDGRESFPDPAEMLPLGLLTDEQLGRLWRLARFVDEPEGTLDVVDGPTVMYEPTYHGYGVPPVPTPVFDQPWRDRADLELLARAAIAGHATAGDVIDALLALGQLGQVQLGRSHGHRRAHQSALRNLTARRVQDWAQHDAVMGPVEQVREAAITGEVARGELTAALTPAARMLRSATGTRRVVALLTALGNRPFARGYAWTDSRESSLSALIRLHFPGPGETAEHLSAALSAAGIKPKRAVEFGVYAPQWAAMIEQHLGWAGFESAVWWVHAHTKDESWTVDAQIREEWASAVAQRTPLDSIDLTRGAADVTWFAEVITTLSEDRFTQVLAAAKYAATSGGHKRAELFANALLGRQAEDPLRERIRTKRHQDSVRALGLLPVTGRDDPALLARYELLRGFVASDKTSGSARRASETTAATIGLENLARTAGYRDPGRLTWAMEADSVRDLAAGPVTATDGTVIVTLSLDSEGAPQTTVVKNSRTLKAIPAAAAKHPDIAAVKARVSELRGQARRMRTSLEASCVTGERFDAAEIADLLAHPVLAPMLRRLVLVSDEGVIGFPTGTFADAPALTLGYAGNAGNAEGEPGVVPVDGSSLRIAHPTDLATSGQWPALQRAAFAGTITQPFRQLFRELYVPTVTELSEAPASRRYANQQVEQRRASGLFTSRGWVADFEVGFGRTFHAEKLTAWCALLGTWGTPGEVEDATIDDVTFTPAGRWQPMPMAEVPPRLFSEVMRDLDLVVSVAHAGGVNPETSESSVEMRARLVEETAEMVLLDNVEVTGHHALIRGKLGKYSVHLGSGQVHRLPGNAICIIPISAQHRGRVFLPFADDDPRTAEIISKVLLLARDDKIQDPSILEQLT